MAGYNSCGKEQYAATVLRDLIAEHPQTVGAVALFAYQDNAREPVLTPAVSSIEIALDGATGDYGVSGDAMRWQPELVEEFGGKL